MSDDCSRAGPRGWGVLPVLLAWLLLSSTNAWCHPLDGGCAAQQTPSSADAPDAGALPASAATGPSVLRETPRLPPGAAEVTLHGVPVTVVASSTLADTQAPGRYGLANLLDGDPTTIWAEGAKGTGAGEWVELRFPPGTRVHAFLVTPGNPRSQKLYRANARPRKARLELTVADGGRLDYVLDFPRDFPMGGGIYVDYRRSWSVQSAKLTVLSVWPGSRYRDLCLGGFVPVLRGPDEDSKPVFLGAGGELGPTVASFMDEPASLFRVLPPKASGESAWLRPYLRIPHDGRLGTPEWEDRVTRDSSFGWYLSQLERHVIGARVQSPLFRLVPEQEGQGYVLGPIAPPAEPGAYENFRVHWKRIEGRWHLVGMDVTYQEESPGDDAVSQ